jgi:hypothetical protein
LAAKDTELKVKPKKEFDLSVFSAFFNGRGLIARFGLMLIFLSGIGTASQNSLIVSVPMLPANRAIH